MNKYAADFKRYYPKAIGSAFIFIIMSFYLITRSDKPREEFLYQKGTISYLSRINPFKPNSEPKPKDVYIILNEHQRVFELFTGSDKGDFSPRTNKLKNLNVGDEVEIYFEENNNSKKEQINRLLQYLDKNGELIYLRSKADKYIGYFVLGCSGLLLLLGIYMKLESKWKSQWVTLDNDRIHVHILPSVKYKREFLIRRDFSITLLVELDEDSAYHYTLRVI